MRPLLDILTQEGLEFRRRLYHRNGALLEPGGLHVGQLDHLVDRGVEEGDNLCGRALGRHQPDPDGRLITRNRFADGRQVWCERVALHAGGGKRASRASARFTCQRQKSMKSISYMRDWREPWLWAFDLSGVRVLLVLALI